MKKYIKPEMEFACFECEDILALSGVAQTTVKTETGSTEVQIVNVADTSADSAAINPFN